MCLKQSLPFVRCVGEGWPLSQDRCRIEAEALMLEYKLCPEHTPEVSMNVFGGGGGGGAAGTVQDRGRCTHAGVQAVP